MTGAMFNLHYGLPSTRTQGQFTEIMLVERPMRIGCLVQPEYARDMNFKRAGLDQAIEHIDRLPVRCSVVSADLYTGTHLGLRLNSVRIGDAPAVAHGSQRVFGHFTTGSKQRGIETGWGKFSCGGYHITFVAIYNSISAKPFYQVHAIVA